MKREEREGECGNGRVATVVYMYFMHAFPGGATESFFSVKVERCLQWKRQDQNSGLAENGAAGTVSRVVCGHCNPHARGIRVGPLTRTGWLFPTQPACP